jgi:hypothetical protein
MSTVQSDQEGAPVFVLISEAHWRTLPEAGDMGLRQTADRLEEQWASPSMIVPHFDGAIGELGAAAVIDLRKG